MMLSHLSRPNDTICAVSTPPGIGGIGIVRMSGPQAIEITQKIFMPGRSKDKELLQGYSIHYGRIRDPRENDPDMAIDEVLLTVMRAPKTYTREDVVEINCHSGAVVVRKILSLLLSLGVRLADPGEFTKRAFLNGRIDLAQAEAVMALISAKSEVSLRSAVQQLSGGLSQKIGDIRSRLVHLLSEVEAAIDFVDEDLDLIRPEMIKEKLQELTVELESLIESAGMGKVLEQGIATAIVGKVNVGKSSLLNRLSLEDRAIVTPFPGTTRDVIEASVNLDGIPLRIMDTAGIRESKDLVEQEGVKRSRKSIEEADLVILMVDISQDPDQEDFKIAELLQGKDTVLVLNKADLLTNGTEKGDYLRIIEIIRPKVVINTSIINDIGINDIKKEIFALVISEKGGFSDSVIITNVRHEGALVSARDALKRVEEGVVERLSEEFLAIDLRAALDSLGRIIGETTNEEVLNEIFRCFCVGK